MITSLAATAHGPGEGKVLLEMDGARIVAKLHAEDTAGACSLIEYTVPPGVDGPPLHRHEETSESFYVLDGTLTMFVDGEELELQAGSFVQVRPGVAHTFANRSSAESKVLILMSPGGFERYFEQLGVLIRQEGTWPLEDMSKVAELQSEFDMVTAGPPPSRTD